MRQKSTERYRIKLPVETIGLIELCASLLSERRMVHHSNSDTVNLAIESVMSAVPTQVKMMCRFYASTPGHEEVIKLRKEVKGKVMMLCKKHNASAKTYLYSVMTIFFRAALSALRKHSPERYMQLRMEYPDLLVRKQPALLPVKKLRQPSVTRRKLNQTKDTNLMRHHNYLEIFKVYMQSFGGLDDLINKHVDLKIHAKPIAGMVGWPSDLDAPKDSSEWRMYRCKIWKRGRGYNLTVIKSTNNSIGEPDLEEGTVFRLYEIYRNIDWESVNKQKEQ
jgi:hypothetical protein